MDRLANGDPLREREIMKMKESEVIIKTLILQKKNFIEYWQLEQSRNKY